MEQPLNNEYLDYLKYHQGRLGEIIGKMELKNEELTDLDSEYLSKRSRVFYKKKLTDTSEAETTEQTTGAS